MTSNRVTYPAQAGSSLMELMFAMAITGFVLASLVSFVVRSNGSMARSEGTSELIYANQRIGDNIRNGLLANTAVIADYGGSPDFSGLHSVMVASIAASATAPQPVAFSLQPVVQNASKPDLSGAGANSQYVGNELFYMAALNPVTVNIYLSGTATISTPTTTNKAVQGYPVSVDRVQFVALYLTQSKAVLKNGQKALRLVEWRSRPYVTLASFNEHTGAYLTATCQALVAAGYSVAVGDYVTDTVKSYFDIATTGVLTGGPAPNPLGEASWAYLDEFTLAQRAPKTPGTSLGRVRLDRVGGQVAAPSVFSFAYNSVSTAASPTVLNSFSNIGGDNKPIIIPTWAQVERSGTLGFPGGFEVVVAGRPGSREILTRYVVMMSGGDVVSKNRAQFLAMDGRTYSTCDTRY